MSLPIGHPWVQHAIKLVRNAKYRRKQLKTIVSSPKIISELPESITVHDFAVTPEFLKSDKVSKFSRISNLTKTKKYFVISHDVAKAITREASPEGIIAEVDIPENINDTIPIDENILILYKISDPGNLGTLLRTAKALNWNRVVLIDDCVDPHNPEAIRSSMGASFKTKFHFVKSQDLEIFIRKNGIRVLIADMNGDSQDVNNKIIKGPVGLLLGSEANGFHGFPREIYDSSTKICIKISNDTDSLNIAICGGILMKRYTKKGIRKLRPPSYSTLMFPNLYDNDVTTWSPQGRIFQIEYAAEAVKQGAVCVGICSKDHVVLAALKRSPGELAAFQKKILPVDDHIGIALAGLTSDARVLSKYMQAQALSSRMNMNRPIPVQRLVTDISDKAQVNTQQYGGRPFGVGLLIAGVDETGTHLFEFSPTGVYNDYVAMSIGARSQSARTYLEKYVEEFQECSLEEVILHALKAIRDSLPTDSVLTAQNCSFGYLSKGKSFEVIEDEEQIQSFLDKLPAVISRSVAPAEEEATETSTEAPAEESAEPSAMDVDPTEEN